MVRLGLHGLGRIGRAVLRQSFSRDTTVVAINDVVDDDNLAYLARYDSVYGRFERKIETRAGHWEIGDRRVARHTSACITDVPWADTGVDVVIDASGGTDIVGCRKLVADDTVRAVIVTRAAADVDATVVAGVNDHLLDDDGTRLISASTCDANAAALVLSAVAPHLPVGGSVITLHPWLGYQNLLDGPTSGFPADRRGDYGVGRAAAANLIPKQTSLLDALEQVLPGSTRSLIAMSYRVPIPSVSCLNAALQYDSPLQAREVLRRIEEASGRTGRTCLALAADARVSSDFRGAEAGATVDARWLEATGGAIRLVAWYDNEAGYAGQVLRIASRLGDRCAA